MNEQVREKYGEKRSNSTLFRKTKRVAWKSRSRYLV